tara:strand:- start:1546 stop:2064 length:519 start_codon:yes stop_codon:yes gene_type:complete
MFNDFDIEGFKKNKPPSNNSFDTMQEIKRLQKIPINKNFINKYDDSQKIFSDIVGKDPIIKDLIMKSGPIIDKLKNHFNRPRPAEQAKKLGIALEDVKLKSMDSPAYPSGHSTQSKLLELVLSDKYPDKKKQLQQAAKNTSHSRQVARTHYDSDVRAGEQLGKQLYELFKLS